MARLFLDSGQTFGNIGGFNSTDVIGTNASEKVFIAADGKAIFDPSFNRGGDEIVILGNAVGYSGALSGSSLLITSTAGASIRIPVGSAGTTITFSEGSFQLAVAAGVVHLGGQTISSTAAPLTSLGTPAPLSADVFDSGFADSPPVHSNLYLIA